MNTKSVLLLLLWTMINLFQFSDGYCNWYGTAPFCGGKCSDCGGDTPHCCKTRKKGCWSGKKQQCCSKSSCNRRRLGFDSWLDGDHDNDEIIAINQDDDGDNNGVAYNDGDEEIADKEDDDYDNEKNEESSFIIFGVGLSIGVFLTFFIQICTKKFIKNKKESNHLKSTLN